MSIDEFFNFDQESKCKTCLITKKGLPITEKVDYFEVARSGDPEVLIILEMPEDKGLMKMFLNMLNQTIKLDNYAVIVGVQCGVKGGDLPKPLVKFYSNCELISEETLYQYKNLKAIVPVGRAITSLTTEFSGYFDFIEYQFNPTYFYTPFQWKKKIRIYPVPTLVDYIRKDNFVKKYAITQFSYIRDYVTQPNFSHFDWVEPKLEMVGDPNQFLRDHWDEPEVAWDTETRGGTFNPYRSGFGVICLTMSFDGVTGYFLDFNKIDRDLLQKWFAVKRLYITANGKYDDNALYVQGITSPEVNEDTTLMFHALSTERISNSLKVIAWFIGMGHYEKDLDEYVIAKKISDYGLIPLKILFPYATLDAIATYREYKLAKLLMRKQPGLYNFYKDYLINVIPVFEKAERKGVPIDQDHAMWLHKYLLEKAGEVRAKITATIGDVDINSPAVLARQFEAMGMPCLGMTASGTQYKVGKDELKEWDRQGYTIASLILEYRTLEKLNGTFVAGTLAKAEKAEKDEDENILFLVDSEMKKRVDEEDEDFEGIFAHITPDNLVHATFGVGRADSFRSSCNDPNLMQLPKRGKLAKFYRPIIKPPPGFYISEGDYEGFQLRIAGIYSKDPKIKRIFTELSGDMHSITAQGVFSRHIPLEDFLKRKKEEPFKTQRQLAKAINFGFIFGGGPGAIVATLKNEMTPEQCKQYIHDNDVEVVNFGNGSPDLYTSVARDFRTKFMETYPGIQEWIYRQREVGETLGYIQSPFGSRRHLPQLTYMGTRDDIDGEQVANLHNICVNSYVQTFEAATIKKAMRRIYDRFNDLNFESYIAAMVHDSMVSMIKKSEVKQAYYIIKEELERDSALYEIPLVSEIDIGRTWGFAPTVKSDKDLDLLEKGGAWWVHYHDKKSKEADWEEVIALEKDHAVELAVSSLKNKNIEFELMDQVQLVA